MCCEFRCLRLVSAIAVSTLFFAGLSFAQPVRREFPPGTLNRIDQLPPGRFRSNLEALPAPARSRALAWLRSVHFTELDVNSLEVDPDGGIFYADRFSLEPVGAEETVEPVPAEAALPVSPFPASLVYHSKPGAPNVLYLNFCGENVSGTAWNNSLGRTLIPAVAFSTDADFTTFSDSEQLAIKRVWERVAEDYAPFDIDVTTERPVTFGTRTAHALITRNTDANGQATPAANSGGVAYLSAFAGSSYAFYRPAWIYYNNLSNNESFIAEAASHEIGHNMGLSHDGRTDGSEYYSGHGSGATSWAPIMGASYNRNVSQWSKGEYYLANNTQDDLATIAAKLTYRPDDHGNTRANATPLVITGLTNILATTPETDPTNLNRVNKGILERNDDVDVFSFTTGSGLISLSINPWIMPSGTRGGNVDLLVELQDGNGATIIATNPVAQTMGQIQAVLNQGTYYLFIRNTGMGDPFSSAPSGYTAYGGIGQYFITGTVAPSGAAPPSVQLVAIANNPQWGSVDPAVASYPAGSSAQVVATPAPYFRFVSWTNDVVGTDNPLRLVLTANTEVEAIFAEILTTNHSVPLWWLASYGYFYNTEQAVETIGANGLPLWQSYVAGLNPTDPNSQLRLNLGHSLNGDILRWNPMAGRTYTLLWTTNLALPFAPIPGASDLPANIQTFNHVHAATPRAFYRIAVRKE